MSKDDAIRLGRSTIEAVLAFADGKLDQTDLVHLGALLGDLEASGLAEAIGRAFEREIGMIDGLRVRVVD